MVCMSKVILFTSSKKEIGKSIIALKTAFELSKSNKAIIIDLSTGLNSVATYAGIEEKIIYDIQDVTDQICSLNQGIIEISDKLDLLPSPRMKDKLNRIKEKHFRDLILELKNYYQFIIIDSPILFNQNFIDYEVVDATIVIADTDVSIIRDIYKIQNLVDNDINIILNKYDKKLVSKKELFSEKDIKKLLPVDVIGLININDDLNNISKDSILNKNIKGLDEITINLSKKYNEQI